MPFHNWRTSRSDTIFARPKKLDFDRKTLLKQMHFKKYWYRNSRDRSTLKLAIHLASIWDCCTMKESVVRFLFKNNKMLSLLTHSGYEGSGIADKIHIPRNADYVNIFCITFISRINHQRMHFITYTNIFLLTS